MLQQMSGPMGNPLVANAAAAVVALGARVAEFQPPAGHRPATDGLFNLPRVLHAARSQNPVERAKALYALQEFMRAPDVARRRGGAAQVRELVTKADFPANSFLAQYIQKFLVIPGQIDMGFEMIFDIHDVATAEGMPLKGSFKTLEVVNGLTFRKLGNGERVQVEGVSGKEVETPYDLYGGAIGFNKVWFDDSDYITIGDLLTVFRAAYYDKRAAAFYALITSLGAGINYNTGGDLMAKMNGAAAAILRAVKDKGYQAAASSEFIVLHPPEKAGDVQAALAIRSDVAQQTAAGKQAAVYRFVPVQSVYVASNDGPYVILPKRKLRGGYRMDLTLYGEFDIYSYAEAMSGWGRYAGLVGDSAQVKRIT